MSPEALLVSRHGWTYDKAKRHVIRARALEKGLVVGFWESELLWYQEEQELTFRAIKDSDRLS